VFGAFDSKRNNVNIIFAGTIVQKKKKNERVMKFPVCEFAEAEEGFYSQCASCPIAAGSAGCALSELEDGNYYF